MGSDGCLQLDRVTTNVNLWDMECPVRPGEMLSDFDKHRLDLGGVFWLVCLFTQNTNSAILLLVFALRVRMQPHSKEICS